MDWIRSCYRTTMNFGTPGFEAVPIVWYFVDETTPHLGLATPFCSRNWQALNKGEGGPLGEVIGAERIYYKGGPMLGRATSGTPCGSAEQWAGLAPLTSVPLTFGFPACCVPVQETYLAVAAIGVAGTVRSDVPLATAAIGIAGVAEVPVAPTIYTADMAVSIGGVAREVFHADAAVSIGGVAREVFHADAAVSIGGVARELREVSVDVAIAIAGTAREQTPAVDVAAGIAVAGDVVVGS